MKITRLVPYAVRVPLKPTHVMITSLGRHDVSQYVVLRVETDAGIEGVGEATVYPTWSGETVWGTLALIEHVLTPAIVGLDPCDVPTIQRRLDVATRCNWFAKSAVEMACWDIRGKEAGKPVYELLGGPHRPLEFRCRYSMGAYPPDEAARRATQLVELGFTTIKVKVGTGPETDIARVRAVRAVIGDRDLVIDANCGYDAATALAVYERIADQRIGLFEQPTPQRDFAALAEVRRAIDCPVMADDIVFDVGDARECLRNDACDVIGIYPGKNGGIARAAEIATLAAEHGVACSIGSNLEYDIAAAAMAHLVVGHPNLRIDRYPGDCLGPDYYDFRIVKNPLSIAGPMVTCPAGPGLGVDVDWGIVEKAGV